MHPVLIYSIVFIAVTIGLLFFFEAYPIGSIYLLLMISAITTWLIGKVMIKILPTDDPMQKELEKEKHKLRSNQYRREIQFLFNLVQPDPKFQPNARRLEGTLAECFDLEEKIIHMRLQQYFGDTFNISIHQVLPDMIEEIKEKYKNWPS